MPAVIFAEQTENQSAKADATYYINGPDYDKMAVFIRTLSVVPVRDIQSRTFKGDQRILLDAGKWQLSKRNCAHAVYECLKAGGAPAYSENKEMTPNRLALYCEELLRHFKGNDSRKK